MLGAVQVVGRTILLFFLGFGRHIWRSATRGNFAVSPQGHSLFRLPNEHLQSSSSSIGCCFLFVRPSTAYFPPVLLFFDNFCPISLFNGFPRILFNNNSSCPDLCIPLFRPKIIALFGLFIGCQIGRHFFSLFLQLFFIGTVVHIDWSGLFSLFMWSEYCAKLSLVYTSGQCSISVLNGGFCLGPGLGFQV